MCIVVDPPLFISMFKASDPRHNDYAPVRDWVEKGPGKFVIGGSLYAQELNAVRSVINVLMEFQRKGKVIAEDGKVIDAVVAGLKKIIPAVNFDDPHLIALVKVSGSRLVCVYDPRSHRYLRNVDFYESIKDRPKLYTRLANRHLLCETNIPSRHRRP